MAKSPRTRDRHGYRRKATIPGHVKVAIVSALGAKPGATTPVECHYCATPGEVWWPLTGAGNVSAHMVTSPFEFDHVYPESKGGPTVAENLVLACRPCNRGKKDRVL